jgi:hypothetical protein
MAEVTSSEPLEVFSGKQTWQRKSFTFDRTVIWMSMALFHCQIPIIVSQAHPGTPPPTDQLRFDMLLRDLKQAQHAVVSLHHTDDWRFSPIYELQSGHAILPLGVTNRQDMARWHPIGDLQSHPSKAWWPSPRVSATESVTRPIPNQSWLHTIFGQPSSKFIPNLWRINHARYNPHSWFKTHFAWLLLTKWIPNLVPVPKFPNTRLLPIYEISYQNTPTTHVPILPTTIKRLTVIVPSGKLT